MLNRLLVALLVLVTANPLPADDPFRPQPGTFPPLDKSKVYRGELVFVDHVNRRGSLRLHVDGHFHEGQLHHFAMLPYGIVRYHGAPADLRDVPIGTVMQGCFYLAPDPKTSVVPAVTKQDVTAPPENHAILLEDLPSVCLREGVAWKLNGVEINGDHGTLVAQLDRSQKGEGLHGEHSMTIDRSTRIWRGRELLGIEDVIADGTWPSAGKKSFTDLDVQLSLTWHPGYLYQQFHVADVWLDETAMKVAADRQRGRHIRDIHLRRVPARVDAIDYESFGRATITATLFGGMDPSIYADFKPGSSARMAAAEDTLRTWWPDHDGMHGKIVAVEKSMQPDSIAGSGIQIKLEVELVLEGFRPGRTVRIGSLSRPDVKPPVEELIRDFEDRWPNAEIFSR